MTQLYIYTLSLCPLDILPPSASKLNHVSFILTLIVPHMSLPCVLLLLVIVMTQLYTLSLCPLHILPPSGSKLNHVCSSTFLTLIVSHNYAGGCDIGTIIHFLYHCTCLHQHVSLDINYRSYVPNMCVITAGYCDGTIIVIAHLASISL